MSMVGPRPALEYEVEAYKPWHRRRLEVTPGVSGLWQVAGRSRVGFDEMVFQDIIYGYNQCLLTDVSICLRTVPAMLIGARSCVSADSPAVALVGYGYWGPNLLRNYMELPEAEVKWVCDRRPEALQKAHSRYPAVGRDHRPRTWCSATASVDAVLVATPISTHHPIARAALEAGKHVFVEKPMTHDVAQQPRARGAGRPPRASRSWSATPSSSARRCARSRSSSTRGELGDIYFVTTQRVNLGPAPEGRQRRLGPRAARHQHPLLLAGEAADVGERHRPRLHRPEHPRRGVHQPALPRAASSPRSRPAG